MRKSELTDRPLYRAIWELSLSLILRFQRMAASTGRTAVKETGGQGPLWAGRILKSDQSS